MKRQWSSMNNLLHRAVRRFDFAPRLESASVCQTAAALGQGRFTPVSFRGGRLKIAVGDYETAAALRPRLPYIIEDLNRELAADAVRSIIIEVRLQGLDSAGNKA